MKLKKCRECNKYTLKNKCSECKKPSFDAHYKFIKVKNAPEKKILKNNNQFK